MKKLLTLLLALLVGAQVMPAFAQDGDSVVDMLAADGQGRFTTLVAALEAAGLAETLSADGDYTIFAPTNDAFDAAAAELGTTVTALMGNIDLLTQMLTYHVVADDRVFFREFSRNPTLTSLEGSELALSVEGGLPTVNGVSMSGIDRAAGNGVVHIIDAVLLPPDLAAMTPEATEAATEEAAATPDATEAVMAEMAMLRFAFLSPDSPPLVLSINGEPAGDGAALAFPSVSAWMSVPAGTMTVSGAPEGEGVQDLLFPFELALQADTWTTLAIVGSEPNGTFIAQPVLEDYSPIVDGNARLTVFHGIEGAAPVDLTADGRAVVSRLAYPLSRGDNDGAYVIELPAGAVDLQFIPSGTAAQAGAIALVDLPDFNVEAGTYSFLAAVGSPDAPDILIETVDADTVAEAGS